jgi:broad specificity phosphatase PhoE
VTSVFFITHPEVVVDPLIPVPQWKLSPRGIARVHRMLEQDWVAEIKYIVASEERKATDTAELLAGHLALSYATRAELGENDRAATGYLPREEFEATADLFFEHSDQSVRGWESARAAQARIVGAIDGILEAAPSVDVAVIAHGGVGALLMCRLMGVPISRAEDQPGEGGGNFFVFRRPDRALLQGWRPIDARTGRESSTPTKPRAKSIPWPEKRPGGDCPLSSGPIAERERIAACDPCRELGPLNRRKPGTVYVDKNAVRRS